MTRRSKPKRARYAYISGHPRSAPAYGDLLSLELWHSVLSYCPPSAILAARDTCRLFRDVVDRNNGELLARAPLLLPVPPPDPRKFMRFIKRREQYRAIRTYLNVEDPESPGNYGSATYTKLLFGPGRCYICKELTGRLPERILHKFYLCSRRCKNRLFHSQVVSLLPRRKYLSARGLSFDRYLVPWLPTVIPVKPQRVRSVLTRDFMAARKEYRTEVKATTLDPQEQKRRTTTLFAYVDRYHQTKVFAAFQREVDQWREQIFWESKIIIDANSRRLRNSAPRRAFKSVLGSRLVQQAFRTHARDLRLVKPPGLLRRAGFRFLKSRRSKCTQCGASISTDGLDWHIVRRRTTLYPSQRRDRSS